MYYIYYLKYELFVFPSSFLNMFYYLFYFFFFFFFFQELEKVLDVLNIVLARQQVQMEV